MKISIIGAGNVGGLTAMQLCSLGFTDIVLIDALSDLARGKALDLNDARFMLGHNYHIQTTDDMNRIADSEMVIITAGMPRKPGMKREELIQLNAEIIRGICAKIKDVSRRAVIIVVTNPLDVMTYLVIKQTGLPWRQIFGMGPTLDRSRLANLIAEKLNIPVTDIEPCVIGSHGEGMLPLSRYTKVKGQPLNRHLSPEGIDELFKKTVGRGAEIVSCFGSGSAYFAPSVAISELARAVARDEQGILPVSAYVSGEYGLEDLCIGLPCCLGKQGIEKIIELELNEQEKAALAKTAKGIKEQISLISS